MQPGIRGRLYPRRPHPVLVPLVAKGLKGNRKSSRSCGAYLGAVILAVTERTWLFKTQAPPKVLAYCHQGMVPANPGTATGGQGKLEFAIIDIGWVFFKTCHLVVTIGITGPMLRLRFRKGNTA